MGDVPFWGWSNPLVDLRRYAEWEDRVLDTPLYNWIGTPRGAKFDPEALQISYWVLFERFVSRGEVSWGVLTTTEYGPFGGGMYDKCMMDVKEMLETDETATIAAAGIFVRAAIFGPEVT